MSEPDAQKGPNAFFRAFATSEAHAKRYAPAYLRAFLYVLLTTARPFNDAISHMTQEQAIQLGWFGWIVIATKCCDAGLSTIIAFLDQTLARINNQEQKIK